MNELIKVLMDEWMDACMLEYVYVLWIDTWIYGWKDPDGYMDSLMDGWMSGCAGRAEWWSGRPESVSAGLIWWEFIEPVDSQQ